MLLYQTNQDGFWTGQSFEARPSPEEEGVFLIPRGCVTVAPPALAPGELARWNWDSETWETIEPAPEQNAPSLDDYRFAIQSHIDATARQRSYDSGITCASYVGSTNPAWAAEAAAFTAWRDAVWVYAYAELAKVENGQRPQPTVETILAELPAMTWPA